MLDKCVVAIVAILAVVSTASAQSIEEKPPSTPVEREKDLAEAKPLEGLWPSPKLMDLMLARWGEDISQQFQLDDDQRTKVKEGVKNRWSGFLTEHRSEIQPIINEFIEMRMELTPPSKDRVKEWADRAMPVFDMFRSQLSGGEAEFREILNPLQRAKFEVEALKFGAGLKMAEHKLKKWRDGDFEADDFWEPTRTERRKRRMERETKEKPAEPAPEDQIAIELKAWDKFAEEFIGKYQLDEGQKAAATSCLSELKERALAHRDARREDIAKLEGRIKNHAGAPEDLAAIKKQLADLYGPIDEMFQELKRRLEQIPTASQRATAERTAVQAQ